MPRALDQIGAAIPDRVMAWLCDIASARREEEIPERERPAEAQQCRNLALQVRLMDGRNLLHEKAVELDYVRVGEFGVGRIRHRRIETVALISNADPHRDIKTGKTVSTDAALGIRRDVSRVNGADGCSHFEAAGEPLAARNRG